MSSARCCRCRGISFADQGGYSGSEARAVADALYGEDVPREALSGHQLSQSDKLYGFTPVTMLQ